MEKMMAVADTDPMTRPSIGPTPPLRSMTGFRSGRRT